MRWLVMRLSEYPNVCNKCFFELYYNVSIWMIVRAIHETLYFNRRNDINYNICMSAQSVNGLSCYPGQSVIGMTDRLSCKIPNENRDWAGWCCEEQAVYIHFKIPIILLSLSTIKIITWYGNWFLLHAMHDLLICP